MCLLYLFIDPNPNADGYRLIAVNVRDEYYSRPTKLCGPWEEDPSIYGAKDLLKGREGGTWLGMNKVKGKIGVLLNILQPNDELLPHKKGRGFLVSDFLKGQSKGESYLQTVKDEADDYNGFLMVTLELSPKNADIHLSYYTNQSKIPPTSLEPGIHSFGNSPPETPWPKVTHGKKLFEDIVSRHPSTSSKSQLVTDLLDFLMNRTEHALDDQMKAQGRGRPEDELRKLTAIFVDIPSISYGSRTHTIILVDAQYHVDFIEKTMKEPIESAAKAEWVTNQHSFVIED